MQEDKLVETMLKWASSDQLWLKNGAMDYQQEYQEQTNEEILETIIVANLGSSEFLFY